jgi:hypothetical protein
MHAGVRGRPGALPGRRRCINCAPRAAEDPARVCRVECLHAGLRKEALVTNALFRMGGSAAILTNNPAARRTAKYELHHCLRVHTGASDRAYK